MRKTAGLVIVAALFGGFVGSLISAGQLQANILDLFRGFLSPGPVTVSAPETSEYASRSDYEQAIIDAVERSAPAVVSIVISKDVPIIEQCPVNPFSGFPPGLFDEFFGSGFRVTQPCQRGTELREVGGGSGFIVSTDGLIVTNKHVALDTNASYVVFLSNGTRHDAKIVAQDPVLDISLLKIDASNLPTIPLGDSDGIKLGQTVIAIGNALGEFRNTVSVGVISGLARTITASGGSGFQETIEGVLQTDAAINRGNSGGPLLNLRSEIVGVNTAIVSGAQNIGFAIPVNQIARAITSFQREGRIVIPYLGVRYLSLNEAVAEDEGLPVTSGALIRGTGDGPAVMPDSPAARAGIQTGDIVLEVGGQAVDDTHSLASLIQRYTVGDEIILRVHRDGEQIDIPVVVEESPF